MRRERAGGRWDMVRKRSGWGGGWGGGGGMGRGVFYVQQTQGWRRRRLWAVVVGLDGHGQ